MKFMLSLLALGYVALATAVPSLPVHPGGIGGLFKGPNSETIIKGPDGSVITSAAEGGEVQSNLEPIVVAEPVVKDVAPAIAPVVAAAPAVAPVVATPAVAAVATPIEAVAVPAPVVEPQQSSDLIGPSGRIATQGSSSVVAGPASTTVTGPAVVAETVVKGPPIIGTAVLNTAAAVATPIATVTASPIAVVNGISAAPAAVTAAPIATVTSNPAQSVTAEQVATGVAPISVTVSPITAVTHAEIAPISVTASPVTTVTGAELSASTLGGIRANGLLTTGQQINTLSLPVSAITVTSPQAVATASPQLSVASASSASHGASVTAEASPNVATASVTNNGHTGVTSVTASPLPVVTSTLRPVIINGIQTASGVLTANDQIDLKGSQLIPDQIAVDNRQLNLNPALIPSVNIIPPEIGITPKGPINVNRLPPRPVDVLTTPGLGSAATAANIHREEADSTLSVTPNTLQIGVRPGLSQDQLNALQYQQALLNNQIQHAQLAAGPREIQTNRQVVDALNNQIQNAQLAAGPREIQANRQLVDVGARNEVVLAPTADPRVVATGRPLTTLIDVQQQQILSAELAKAGIDASQVQLTNVPLSDVSALPANLTNSARGSGPNGAWERVGREAKDDKN